MMYIIFNSDGTIEQLDISDFIQQGNDGVNEIFISINDVTGYTASALCTLPNESTAALVGTSATYLEKEGFKFTLTSAVTVYAGTVLMAIQCTKNNTHLITYPIALTINETGVTNNSDLAITNGQLRTFLAALNGKQTQLSSDNAGTNITITTVDGVLKISASGGGSGTLTGATLNGTSIVSNNVAVLTTKALSSTLTADDIPAGNSVYNECQDIREVAEGKCKTYVLYDSITFSEVKTAVAQRGSKVYLYDGTEITSDVAGGDYDDVAFDNDDFNSQSTNVAISGGGYILGGSLSGGLFTGNFTLISIGEIAAHPELEIDAHTGDIFLVIETDVPDRWLNDKNGSFQILETTKVNLNTKLDIPTNTGTTGQVIKKASTGTEYGNVSELDYKSYASGAYTDLTGLKFVKISASDYATITKDTNTLYMIVG